MDRTGRHRGVCSLAPLPFKQRDMNNVRKVKGLKSQLNNLLGESESLKIEMANKQREYDFKMNKIKALQSEISKYKKDGNIKLSEHAVIRYLERVKGLNISDLENEIVTTELKTMVEKLGGNGVYPINGISIKMKDFTITTITN